ncbi:acyltransferase [Palleronia caenipelagi]|uniref:acyltransferase n=1 Tax=Palleronia caenipelagi TaxID=2489174 RepID=UPI00163D3F89|nr:acyltransferase [Palleronia caenipelagi]
MSNGRNPFDPGYYRTDELRQMGFAAIGENVSISKGCNIIGLPHISIGDNVRIDFATTIIAGAAGVRIGSYIHIGAYGYISGGSGVDIGNFANLSQRVSLYTSNDNYLGGSFTNPMVPAEHTDVARGPIRLGAHVLLGSGTIVLPDADIPEGVSCGALSLMKGPFQPWTIYAGQPARALKARTPIDPEGRVAATLLGQSASGSSSRSS